MIKRSLIFFVCLIFSLILLALAIFDFFIINDFKDDSFFMENSLYGLDNRNEIIEAAFLDEYKPIVEGEEEIFLDKKFLDKDGYIISSLNSYSAEWYPSGHPKEDLKKLTIELQITDKATWKNFSLRGTADIPKYYSGSFDFDTSTENFVVFKDLNPSFVWEYSEDYTLVSVEKEEFSTFEEGDLKSITTVDEKVFDKYVVLDEELKKDIPSDLFLDPDISACGTLGSAGATYDLTAHVSTVTPGTCFTVTAANVTLDCHGYWVNYSGATPSRYGVYTNQFNTTVKNCKINNFNTTGGYYDSIGIYFLGADNGTIFNCYANNSNSAGIYLTGNANYNNITNSIGVTANSSQGMRLHDSHYNILLNNIGITRTNEGFGITGGSSYNTIINQTAYSYSGRGVFFWQGAHDNVLIGLNASTLISGEAVRFHNATNNIIMDSVSLDGGSYDVYYYTDLGSTGNVFLNCDYDTEYITPSNSLIRQWYYQAYVNYSNGSAASGVNVTARNSSSVIIFTDSTTSSGLISKQNVTEYVNTGGTRSYYNNYSINASKSGYTSDTNTINFTITENKVNDFLTLDITGDNLLLKIINPTTSNSLSVSSGENISVYFNVSDGGSNVTSGVSINSVFIGGINSTILNMTGVNGSTPEQVPISCVDNYYSSDMEAYSNWTIPGSGDINVTSFFLFQNDTTMSSSENTTIKFYHANGTEIGNTEIIVYGTGAREWTYANYSTPFTLTRGKSYYVGMLMTSGFNLARDANHDCANYLPNQGSYYTSPTDWVLDSSVPTASLSEYHYGIFGVGYETYGNVPSNKYITNVGWQVNVSVPTGLSGLQDLFVNATYGGFTLDDTESNAINYGGDTDSPSIAFENPTPGNDSSTTSPVTIVANISDASNTSSWMDLDRSLLGYWAMDYANSTHVFDNSSYKRNATFRDGLGTSDIITGIRGDALNFDGGANYLEVPISHDYSKMTYSYWINNDFEIADIPTGGYEGIYSYSGGSDYALFFADDRFIANFHNGTGQQHFVNWYPSTINRSEWHHIMSVVDADVGYVALYLDGDLIQNRTFDSWTPATKTTLKIGTWYSYYYNGSIDEFMLFNRTLSETEVKALYSSQANKFNTSTMNLADGQYYYTVYAIDEAGNTANSGLRSFDIGIDSDSPSITFELPTPSNTSTASNPVTIVANISDASNTSSWIDFDRTLVGYWAMDYYNSTGIYDNSSWDNFGVFAYGTGINGISTGVRGDSLEFYGNNSRLNMNKLGSSTAETFNGSGQLTFSVWIKPDVISWQGLMGTNTVRFHITTPSRIRSGIYNATAQYQFDSPDILSTGQWQHVALTYNRSNGNASSYHNGILVGSRIILNANLTGAGDYFNVGQNWGDFFDGRLDEVMVFNRTLSQTEIKALYDSKSNKFNTSAMNLADGQHNYTVYAIDEYGNAESSGLRNFDVGEEVVGENACGTLSSSGVYTLTTNVSSTGTCFTITTANVTLDCGGHSITYSTNGQSGGNGVYSNQLNSTIKNCVIIDGNTSTPINWRNGIYLYYSNYSTLFNNSVSVYNSTSLYIYGTLLNLTKNNFTSTMYEGITAYYIHNSTFANNNITTYATGRNGFYLVYSTNVTLFKNNATSPYRGFGCSSLNNSNLTNNFFLGKTSSNNAGMIVSGSNNNILVNNTGYSSGPGIFLWSYSQNNTLINNTGISTGGSAGLVIYTSSGNTVLNQNATGLSSGGDGIAILQSNNTLIKDCVYLFAVTNDIENYAASVNNTILNCSYDTEYVTGISELTRKWYYQAYVNYSNGSSASGVNVVAYNTTGQTQFSAQTNSSGWISRQNVTEYVNTGGTRSYYNNYSINASKSGYITDNNIFNFTVVQNKVNDFFTLTGADSSSPIITFEEPPTPTNGSTTSSYVEIVANISDASNTSSWIDFDRTLVGYWAMDYYNSTGIYDNSTWNNFGKFNGNLSVSNITTGKRGEGLEFDGVSDYLTAPDSVSLAFGTGSFSVSGWFKVNDYTLLSGEKSFINKYNGNYDGWRLEFSGSTLYFRAGDGTPSFDAEGGFNTSVTDNNWHLASLIVNREDSTVYFYFDGNPAGSTAISSTTNWDTSELLYIGKQSWASPRFPNGLMDEVMIFNRSLSISEIKALYSSQINKFNTSNLSYSDGQHNYTVYAIDEYGNTASSGLRNFVVSEEVVGENACGTLSSPGIYTLTSDVSSTGTCFTVTSSDVILDCNGHSITYSTSGGNSQHGFYTNQLNSTIKNCVVIDGNTSTSNNWRNGIYFSYSNYSIILNNSVSVYNATALAIYGTYMNATNNNFTSNLYEGVNAYYIHNSTFTNNSISTNTNNRNGMYIGYSTNVTLFKNNASSPYRGFGCYSLNQSNLSNNFFLGKTASNNAGMILSGSYRNTLVNNTGYSSGPGIYFWSYSENNTLINNTGISTGGSAGLIFYTCSGNVVINQNATGLSSGGDGISIIESNNTIIKDCKYIYGATYDIINNENSINNTFLNCSYDLSKEYVMGAGQLIRKWYYQAYVNYSNGTYAAGANVVAYNTTGQTQFTVQTNSSGWIQRQNVTEYVSNGGTRTYYNNYTINASKTGYITDSNVWNFTTTQNKINDFFTLTGADSTSPIITFEEPPTPSNGSSTSSFVTIVANISDASNTSSWIDLDRSLVGYWAMDYYNSTNVFDNSSYRNNATFQGGLGTSNLITGKRGDALEFDGSNDYLKVKDSNSLDIGTNDFSISFWGSFGRQDGGYSAIFGKKDGVWASTASGYEVIIKDDGNIFFHFGDGSTYVYTTDTTTNFSNAGWKHFVVTADRDGNAITYVDGVVERTNSISSAQGSLTNTLDIGIMTRSDGNYASNGSLDEVMMFNRTLSETEVKALYSSQINKFNTSNLSYSDGQHNYTVYAIDEYGNTASSGERNFDVSSGLDCGTLSSSGVYTLTKNVSSTGTCFTVSAANVTIDCNGYWINYSTGGVSLTHGVVSNGQFNTTIKNCNIVDGNWSNYAGNSRYAIYFNGADNSTIFSNFVNVSNSYSIHINNHAYYNNLTNNIIYSEVSGVFIQYYSNNSFLLNNRLTSNSSSALFIGGSSNNSIINNTITSLGAGAFEIYTSSNNLITKNNATSYSNLGISISSSLNNVLMNNTVTGNLMYGLWLMNSNNTLIISNNFSSNNSQGILFQDSNNNNLTNNTAISSFYQGIYLLSSSNNILTNNNATSNTSSGIYISSSNNNTLTNNIATSITYHGIDVRYSNNNILTKNNGTSLGNVSAGSGIFISSSLNNTLSNNLGKSFIGSGFYLDNSSYHNLLNNIATSSSGYGIYLTSSSNNNLTGNNATSNTSNGIYIESSSNNNLLTSNNATSNTGFGIWLSSSLNNILTNNIGISNSSGGIYLLSSLNNTLIKNNGTSYGNIHGIWIRISSNNTLTNNTGKSNENIGIYLDDSSNIILINNTGTSNSSHGIYLGGSGSNNTLTNNIGTSNMGGNGIWLSSSNNNLLNNNATSNSGYGIYLLSCSNNTLTNNTATSTSSYGIYLYSFSKNNTLTNNTAISNSSYGIYIRISSNNNLTNNKGISNSSHGIYLYSLANSNTLTNNNATSLGAGYGIYLWSASNNTLTNNTATSTSSYGIYLESSSNNNLTNNIFISNSSHGIRLSSSLNNTLTFNIGTSLGGGAGIYFSSSSNNNTLINNTFTSNSNYGIYFSSSSINTLINNIGKSNLSGGIQLSSSSNNTLTNNTGISNSSYGIYLTSSSNNTLTNNNGTSSSSYAIYLGLFSNYNTLTNNTGTSNSSYGIYLNSASNNTLTNNTATSLGAGYGIYLNSASNNTLTGNNATSNSSHGIYLTSSSNNNLTSNNGTSYGSGYAIYLTYSSNNILINNTGIATLSGNGLRLESSSNNIFVKNNATSVNTLGTFVFQSSNNTFTDCSSTSVLYRPLYILQSLNNTFINQIARVLGTGSYGVSIRNSNNTIFRDCINISGVGVDVFFENFPLSINNTFINCSYNTAKETVQGSGNELIRKWYYQAYVNYSNGSAAAGANVSAYNVSSSLEFTDLTAGTGWTDRQEVTEYINRAGTRSYFNNYSISPTKTGYYAATHIFNFTTQQNKMDDWFTLYNTTCVYLNGNWQINCSESCTVVESYDVQGNNISIVGAGTILVTGNVTNYQNLHIEGVDTTHICTVRCINGGCFKS